MNHMIFEIFHWNLLFCYRLQVNILLLIIIILLRALYSKISNYCLVLESSKTKTKQKKHRKPFGISFTLYYQKRKPVHNPLCFFGGIWWADYISLLRQTLKTLCVGICANVILFMRVHTGMHQSVSVWEWRLRIEPEAYRADISFLTF